jgi:alkanesulfonate monooxygenase SsuD/methylene tetrahydromethanopterin reductase-like flavin-dependent oxidoreductase (luciferase family)
MKWGVNLFVTEYTLPPDELGREVEARGFESLWVAEHTHIPVARSDARALARDYWYAYDPFLALVAAASSTSRIALGTGIVLVPQRDPIVTA